MRGWWRDLDSVDRSVDLSLELVLECPFRRLSSLLPDALAVGALLLTPPPTSCPTAGSCRESPGFTGPRVTGPTTRRRRDKEQWPRLPTTVLPLATPVDLSHTGMLHKPPRFSWLRVTACRRHFPSSVFFCRSSPTTLRPPSYSRSSSSGRRR